MRANGGVPDVEPGLVPHDRAAPLEDRLPVGDVVQRELHDLGQVRVCRNGPHCRAHRALEPLVVRVVRADVHTEHVAARLRDRVDDAAGRARELGVVAAGLDLHFLDEVGDDRLAGRPVLEVGGVDAVDDEAVLGAARAADRHAAGARFEIGARRHRDHGAEVAALRDAINQILTHRRERGVLFHVDDRRVGRDVHALRHLGGREGQRDCQQLAEHDDRVLDLRSGEACERGGDGVRSRRQGREPVVPL